MLVDIVQVTTTCDSLDALTALVHDAVGDHLAACGQIEGPVTSIYWWQEPGDATAAVHTATEWRATFKTTATLATALEGFITERHPYDTPEVLRFPVTGGNQNYLGWVRRTVTAPGQSWVV